MSKIKKAANGREINPDFQLTPEHVEEMKGCKTGADIYGYTSARLLREVETNRPELLSICEAMNHPPGASRQPYFGCILTKEGIAVVKNFKD